MMRKSLDFALESNDRAFWRGPFFNQLFLMTQENNA